MTTLSRLRSAVVPWILVVLLAVVVLLPICDLHFDCGCRWPGLGGASQCDIHTAGPPDCPWCKHPWIAYGTMAASAGLGLIAVLVIPARTHWAVAASIGMATAVLGELAAGIVTSLWLGLPALAGL